MSEQSPWGTPPPPNDPYGTPAQPQQPAYTPVQPPYPTDGGYAGGPPSYGVPLHGPGGPPPPKRRTGVIVAIVAAVVLVIAAFTVTFIVASDDGDDPQQSGESPSESGTSSDSPSESVSDPTSDPPSETTSESPSETTSPSTDVPPATGDTVAGNGYSFSLPDVGWTDVTEEAKGSVEDAPSIDTVVVLGSSIPISQSNVIVEASGDGGAPSLEDLEGLWKRNLIASDGATTSDIDDTEIDGERAIGVEISGRTNAVAEPITQIAYLVQHDGMQYSIGLSYPASGDTISRGDFEKLLASWVWR